MEDLCNDLLTLIFKKLSPPTLRSLRLVCKRWNSIIVSQDFAREYLSRPTNKARLLLGFWAHDNHPAKYKYNFWFWSYNFLDRRVHYCTSTPMFLHPPNTASFSPSGLHPPHEFASRQLRDVRVVYHCVEGVISHETKIINPSLGWSIDIPRIDSEEQRVLGYVPISNKYKLLALSLRVGIGSSNGGGDYQVLTVGEASKKWRTIESESTPELPRTNSICINGFVYYITLSGEMCTLVRFDVSKEKLDFFKIQNGPCDDLVRCLTQVSSPGPFLLDLKGKVSVVTSLPDLRSFRVWILKEDPTIQSWSVSSFSLPHLLFYHLPSAGASCVDKNTGEIIMVTAGLYGDRYMEFVNLEANATRRMQIMDGGSLDIESFAIRDYKESLFGLCGRF